MVSSLQESVTVALPCNITFCFPMQAIDHQSCSCPTRECYLVINHHYLQWEAQKFFSNRNTATQQSNSYVCLELFNFIKLCSDSKYIVFIKLYKMCEANSNVIILQDFPTRRKGTFRSKTMLNGPRKAIRNRKLMIQPSEGSLTSSGRLPG